MGYVHRWFPRRDTIPRYGVILHVNESSSMYVGNTWLVRFWLDDGTAKDIGCSSREDLKIIRGISDFIPSDNKLVGSKCGCGGTINPLSASDFKFKLRLTSDITDVPEDITLPEDILKATRSMPFGVRPEERRRLTNQSLIDRFIRESLRCQNS